MPWRIECGHSSILLQIALVACKLAVEERVRRESAQPVDVESVRRAEGRPGSVPPSRVERRVEVVGLQGESRLPRLKRVFEEGVRRKLVG